jgi:Spa2 homology domain (SHD) of GIT
MNSPLDSNSNSNSTWRRGGNNSIGSIRAEPTSPYGQPSYAAGGLSERDDPRRNQYYPDSQLSPGSEFSVSKYDQQGGYQQQRNLSFSNTDTLPNNRMSQRSSGISEAQEAIVIDHYNELHSYIHSNPAVDGVPSVRAANADNANARQSKAREKLQRLSPTQFNELSTDVYDERVRRKKPHGSPVLVVF